MNSPTLSSQDQKWILRNTLRMLDLPGSKVLGYAVAEVCGVGSGTGSKICRELGWNPDHTIKEFFAYDWTSSAPS